MCHSLSAFGAMYEVTITPIIDHLFLFLTVLFRDGVEELSIVDTVACDSLNTDRFRYVLQFYMLNYD